MSTLIVLITDALTGVARATSMTANLLVKQRCGGRQRRQAGDALNGTIFLYSNAACQMAGTTVHPSRRQTSLPALG